MISLLEAVKDCLFLLISIVNCDYVILLYYNLSLKKNLKKMHNRFGIDRRRGEYYRKELRSIS